MSKHGSSRAADAVKFVLGKLFEDGQWQDRSEFDRAELSIDVLNPSFDGFLVYLLHCDRILEMCLKILVQMRTTGKQKMDIEGIPSFHMTAIEKSITFLKQQIVRAWRGDDFFWSAGDSLLDDVGLQDIPADAG